MLPVSKLKGHRPVAMITCPWPSLALTSEAPPPGLWLAGHSGGWYNLRPRPLYYPAPYWTPQEVSVVRWEFPGLEMVPLLPPLYHSPLLLPPAPPPAPPPLPKICWRTREPKLVDGWIYPEDLVVYPQLTNQITPRRHTPRTRPLLSPAAAAALLGGVFREWAVPLQWHKGARPDRKTGPEREVWPVMTSLPVSLLSRKSSTFTLLTNFSAHKKRGAGGAGGCGRGLAMTREREADEGVYDQFVKSRIKEEYKEKKTKLLQAKDQFKLLLEEAKITIRSTFKQFCLRYRGDHRFLAFNRKKEQEVLFNHYITSLKKRDKENRPKTGLQDLTTERLLDYNAGLTTQNYTEDDTRAKNLSALNWARD
ncbi:hypothetical protein CRUP_001453 [Coryphaenoides rupestris]|nr:hypothetical protein CRUP_001453 [Coryphaenoides rupestris]